MQGNNQTKNKNNNNMPNNQEQQDFIENYENNFNHSNSPNRNAPEQGGNNPNSISNANNANIPQRTQEINFNLSGNPDGRNFIDFNELYNMQDLPSKEKFLFLFKIDSLANQSFCGCSLRLGVKIIAILFLAAAMSKFFSAFEKDNILNILLSAVIFCIYFIAGYCLIYSSIYLNAEYAYYGYVIYAIIFFYLFLQTLLMFIFIVIGFYDPVGELDFFYKLVALLFAITIMLGLHLYFIWICYSFWMHLKNKNFDLINGNFYRSYEDYTNLHNRNN